MAVSFRRSRRDVPGLRFSEHLPGLSELADQLAIVRGLSTAKEIINAALI